SDEAAPPPSPLAHEAKDKLTELLARMGLEGEVVAREDEERITLEIRGVDSGLVIGRQGATLDALQYLVAKMVSRGQDQETPEAGAREVTGDAGDTLGAGATATGGGSGIVRVSGPRAASIARALVRPGFEDAETHRLYHGHAHHPDTGEALDEVLACLMRAPR